MNGMTTIDTTVLYRTGALQRYIECSSCERGEQCGEDVLRCYVRI